MFRSIVHPGSILKDELDELSITPRAFARQMDLPTNRVSPPRPGLSSGLSPCGVNG